MCFPSGQPLLKFVTSRCEEELVSFRMSETLPTGQLSNIPWRRTGVRYTNNEAYFDVIEEIDAIIDKSGSTVCAEIQGYVSLKKYLSYAQNLATLCGF